MRKYAHQPKSEMDSQRELLDSLMGINRNNDRKEDQATDFRDERVCKFYITGMCPHDIFVNTKLDEGPCPRIHSEGLKKQFESSKDKFIFDNYIEREFLIKVGDADRVIKKARQKLEEEMKDENLNPDINPDIMRIHKELSKVIQEAEKAYLAGDIDRAQELVLYRHEDLQSEKQAVLNKMESYRRSKGGSDKKLRVCDVCGSYLSIYDSDKRLQDHFLGKQHIGYQYMRDMLDAIKKRREENRINNNNNNSGSNVGSGSRVGGDDNRHGGREDSRDRYRRRDSSRDRYGGGGRDDYYNTSNNNRDRRDRDRDRERDRERDRDYRDNDSYRGGGGGGGYSRGYDRDRRKKEKSTNATDTSGLNKLYVFPDESDHAALKEIEVQRYKWNDFLKNRPKVWSEEWLWQNWKHYDHSNRPIKKKLMLIFSPKVKTQKRIKKLIRAGVPPEFRGSVWWACSGAEGKMKAATNAEQYKSLLKRLDELSPQIISDIEKDLLRTFPDRIKDQNGDFIESMRCVLSAYAVRNPTVGYCQSMNFICALLLFHLSEEHSFWVLAVLIEDFLPNNYYAPTLMGGRIDQQVFQSCIAGKLPKLHNVFKETNTLLEPIICPWFLCLYINVLPLYTVCRVWDCMFWEGNEVLFRIGLTLLKSKAKYILQAQDYIAIYTLLKSGSTKALSNSFELERHSSESSNTSTTTSTTTATTTNTTNNNNAHHHNSITQTLSTNNLSLGISDFSHMSDTEYMISSAFGFKWLRSVPKPKIDLLRTKFFQLLDNENNERNERRNNYRRNDTNNNNNNSGAGNTNSSRYSEVERPSSSVPSSPSSKQNNNNNNSPSKDGIKYNDLDEEGKAKFRRTRKSALMLRFLTENDVHNLQALAIEVDEGLKDHVEEFARELNPEGTSETMDDIEDHSPSFKTKSEEDDSEEDEDDGGGCDGEEHHQQHDEEEEDK